MWVIKLMLVVFLMYQVDTESVTAKYHPIFTKLKAKIDAAAEDYDGALQNITTQTSQLVASTQAYVEIHITDLRETVAKAESQSDKNIDSCVKNIEETIDEVAGMVNQCSEPESIKVVKEIVLRIKALWGEVRRNKNTCVYRYSFQPDKLRKCFDETIADAEQVLADTEESLKTALKDALVELTECIFKELGTAVVTLQVAQNTFNKCVQ